MPVGVPARATAGERPKQRTARIGRRRSGESTNNEPELRWRGKGVRRRRLRPLGIGVYGPLHQHTDTAHMHWMMAPGTWSEVGACGDRWGEQAKGGHGEVTGTVNGVRSLKHRTPASSMSRRRRTRGRHSLRPPPGIQSSVVIGRRRRRRGDHGKAVRPTMSTSNCSCSGTWPCPWRARRRARRHGCVVHLRRRDQRMRAPGGREPDRDHGREPGGCRRARITMRPCQRGRVGEENSDRPP